MSTIDDRVAEIIATHERQTRVFNRVIGTLSAVVIAGCTITLAHHLVQPEPISGTAVIAAQPFPTCTPYELSIRDASRENGYDVRLACNEANV